jgi:transcriptional antiterminator RfaH
VSLTSDQRWHVLRTHPRQEFRTEQNLQAGGIDVFLPCVAPDPTGRGHARKIQPMFPQYLFARFQAEARLNDVSFTRGVQAPLRIGETLAVVEDTVIEFLQSRVESDGLIHVGKPLEAGDAVIVEDGPFAALVGIVERCVSSRERVIVLLTALSTPVRVDLAVHAVRRIPAAAV